MIYKYNDYSKLFESTLKDAKLFAEKQDDGQSNLMFDAIKKLLSKKVKSKYCHKNDNFHLALLFMKLATKENLNVFSNLTSIQYKDNNYDYDDILIDKIIDKNDNSLETLLCYLLKNDKYLNYLPIKPITAYNEKNVKRYHISTGGNQDMGVYETLTDHIIRFLPAKLQSNEWVREFPSILKSDYKQNQDEYENRFLSILSTYNTLDDKEKEAIYIECILVQKMKMVKFQSSKQLINS